MTAMLLQGLSAFPITPADAEGRVDQAGLGRLLQRLVTARVDSIGLLGSTGSYPYLSRAERRGAIEQAVALAGDIPVLAGIGALRTDEAVALARDAFAAGARAGLLAPVSYTPLLDDEVFSHFQAVAAASDLPLVIYDNPGTTHFSFSPALVGRLSQLPKVVAVKGLAPAADAVAAHLATLKAGVPDDFSVGVSGDWNAAEALLAGAAAWYSVAGGLFPEPCLAITRAAKEGRAAEARQADDRLQPLWAVFRRHTSLRCVYAAADILGLADKAPPRPILPLQGEARKDVAAALQAAGLSYATASGCRPG
ncbi:dihydrodipicolinate synthase family protein [Pseudoroseomonas deserti]|uniref:Dihydrodipicolinate synthase family protein n=2 Tax=Teichococcus deserti TaxID=1817963 RepID=A0A1V2GXM6_9PROT|nr:dihydrodipicolinate synthase family protein [Pseudoroseomonas deserti]